MGVMVPSSCLFLFSSTSSLFFSFSFFLIFLPGKSATMMDGGACRESPGNLRYHWILLFSFSSVVSSFVGLWQVAAHVVIL